MKTSTLPAICGLSLAAMSAAGLSHWWTVREVVAAIDAAALPTGNASSAPEPPPAPAPLAEKKETPPAPPTEGVDGSQKEFYAALLAVMKKLRTENRDLLDQMAETNRDLMKLEFRVDTHSESFRPLPVSEDRMDTSLEDSPGVLPPRALPVPLPSGE